MNSARLAKMQCPNCESIGTIDIDDVEAQMYCTECCIVLAMNLGESDQTRYDGNEGLVEMKQSRHSDETMLDDGDTNKGGGSSSTKAGGGGGAKAAGSGKKMDAVYDFIQCLQRKAAVPDSIAIGAVALYSEFLEKLFARTNKKNVGGDGGQNAVAAAAFSITAARKGRTVAATELAKYVKDLTNGTTHSESQWANFILIKKMEMARLLGVEAEVKGLADAEFDHLAQQFHLAMQWPLVSAKAAAAFARALNRELSAVTNTSVSSVEAVVVGMYMTRASKKLSSLLVAPVPSGTPQSSTSDVLRQLASITRVDLKAITAILTTLQSNKAVFEQLLNLAIDTVPRAATSITTTAEPTPTNTSTSATLLGQKRERQEDQSEIKVQLR